MDLPRPREDTDLLTVSATSEGGVVWIVVSGEVDLANREQLRRQLASIELGPAGAVYLDLRLLVFCDSAGCDTLLRFERQAAAAGCDVRIHRARPIVCKVLNLVRATGSY